MTQQPIDQTGGCLCGAVRFHAQGVPKWVAHCHCPTCRRQTGAAFATYAGYKATDFVLTDGQPAAHQSSPGVTRRFCATCGSPLTYESARWPGEVHVLIGAMDAPEAFTPQAHVYVAHQMQWLRLDDGLPRYAATAAAGAPL